MKPISFRRPLLLAAVLLAGCGKAPAPPETTPAALVVWQGPLAAAPEEWVELVGSTQPLPECVGRVTAPIDGRIDALLPVVKDDAGKVVKEPHEGEEVAKNDVIVHLDDRIPRFNRDKMKSAVDSAWQEVAQARIARNLAVDQLTSLQELKKEHPNLAPDIQMKTAQGAVWDAQSKLLGAQQRHDQAKRDAEALEAQLGLYTLKAPIDGKLGRILPSVGQTLTAGGEVAEIVNIEDQIDVLCFVSQRDAAHLKVGQPANLGGFTKGPDEVWTADLGGQVAYVSDKAEPESGCFVVKVRFPNKNPHLRGNLVQRVRVQTREGEQQPSLREDWLIEDRDPPTVVIVEEGKPQKNSEGKDEATWTARRMQALISVRDRENKLVGLRGLVDSEGKEYSGPLDKVQFVTEGAQGLETDDPVRQKKPEKE